MTAAKHNPLKFAGDAYELVQRVAESLDELLYEYRNEPEKMAPGRLSKSINRLITAKGELMTCQRLREIEAARAQELPTGGSDA